ncbi:MAG: CBS domain-containing protein [bacterium]
MVKAISTLYLSRILGNPFYSKTGEMLGRLQDLVVDADEIRPKVIAAKVKIGKDNRLIDFSAFEISKVSNRYILRCEELREMGELKENILYLFKSIVDKQIVDMYGRKVVRVNDLRLANLSSGTYLVAVDVGIEGLLRRLGVARTIKSFLKPLGKSIPSKLILWDEVATIGFSNLGLKLSKTDSKLYTLHPSDLADIIEDLDRKTQAAVFAALDEEKAADVMEELETDAQISILGSLTVEKAADLLEKMPADEAADILDELDDEEAEKLLREMEIETSEEVRELMEYPENTVGSFMSTDYFSFRENLTVNQTILSLRHLRPEANNIYYLYVVDEKERIVGTVSLRDLIVSEPDVQLEAIMNREVVLVHDSDKLDSMVEIVSKYNLLAIPVVDDDMKMLGMVIIDDLVHNLLKARKRQ